MEQNSDSVDGELSGEVETKIWSGLFIYLLCDSEQFIQVSESSDFGTQNGGDPIFSAGFTGLL